jgi:opacity protein-like surface antigen
MALSLDVFLRLPLFRSETTPGGRVQPYVLAGAPLFITSFTPRNSPLFRNADGDTDLSFGYKGGAGLAVYIFRNLMVFGEYRYTHVEHEFEIRDINAHKATLRTELNSHTGLVGLGARW